MLQARPTGAQGLTSRLGRRHFLMAGVSAAGGLAIGVATQAQAASLGAAIASPENAGPHEINAWIVIDPDEAITVRLAHAEMGQGAATALPMIVAEELACDWTKVKVEYASANRNLREKNVYGTMTTSGSRGTRGSLAALQAAGAGARARLVAVAAKRWNVPEAQCAAADSKVSHAASGRVLSYGALAADAAKVQLAAEPAVKTPDQFTVIGQPYARLDTPLKVDGSAKYAMDTRVPGMVYAAVIACPVPGGKLRAVDGSDVSKRHGILAVVSMSDSVAVAADNFWQAKQALDGLRIEWDYGAGAGTNSATFNKEYRDALNGPKAKALDKGKFDETYAAAAKKVEAVYEVPYLAHAPMEPMNATVHIQPDRVDVWIGTQAPSSVIALTALHAGMPAEKIFVHNTFLGGGFGRKTQHDELIQAIAVAKVVQRPVQLIWTREEDIQHDRFRPQAALSFKAGLDKNGMPVACEINTAVGSLFRSLGRDKVENGVEPMAVEGLTELPYKIANHRVGCILKNTHVPVMFWRSVGASQNAFALESFIDEAAHAAGKDPVAFRRDIVDRKDFLGVLDMLATKSNWGSPMPKGKGRGLAIFECYGTIVGQTAEVAVDSQGVVKVERVVAVVDCGHVVNPKIVESQIQGAVLWGISAALFGEITVKDGRIEQSNFSDYPIARMADTPEVEVYLALSGGTKWGGIGEPGSAPVAPAICNAVFAATGKRIRSLPIRAQALARSV